MTDPRTPRSSPTFAWPGGTLDAEDDSTSSMVAPDAPQGALIAERYRDLGPLGIGGMGEVRRVWDTRLARSTAMKIIRVEKRDQARAVERFVREAHTTGRLQHPGVVPVHDMGQLSDGRWWFTMKEIVGRTYEEALGELHAQTTPESWPDPRPGGPSFRRLVDALLRACQTMAYAHAEGFVHRDLKPDNLMLGRFGEVLVLDWGLGKMVDAVNDEPQRPSDDPLSTADAALRASATLDGGVLGSPPYMAPEQARGQVDGLGPAMDVYALGAVLYHLLAGVPPYRGRSPRDIVEQVRAGPPLPVARTARFRCPEPDPELVIVCERAMARQPGQRFSHAGELARALEDWLDGTRRQEEARAIVAAADGSLRDIQRQRESAGQLRREAEQLLVQTAEDAAGEAAWRDAWEREERADALDSEIGQAEAEYEVALQSALKLASSLPEAHERLADLYRLRLERAEQRRDGGAVAQNEAQLRAHDRGRHAGWLRAQGRLSLVTDPPGATVTVSRLVQRHRRMVAVEPTTLGTTPLVSAEVPRGSVLLELRHPERPVVRVPLVVRRSEHLDHRPPGAAAPVTVPLPDAARLEPDLVYVPAGWAMVGGDPLALDALPLRRVWIDGFAISRGLITIGAYRAFLESLVSLGRAGEALARVPRISGTGGDAPLWTLTPTGQFQPTGRQSPNNPLDDERLPITRVSCADAMAYAAWMQERTGLPWRLPQELEWEKAARGVAGWAYPWGDSYVEGRANVSGASPGTPALSAVGAYPLDQSIYGLLDAAGNARTWCANPYRRACEVEEGGRLLVEPRLPEQAGGLHVIRGGSFASLPHVARLASRFGANGDLTYAGVGFHVLQPIPGR